MEENWRGCHGLTRKLDERDEATRELFLVPGVVAAAWGVGCGRLMSRV
jgi:hypothetical protein